MEPAEALTTAAQIAVALAGFAGVVVVFRRESVHEWPAVDKFRLRLLLLNSVLPFGLCMLGLLLLTVESASTAIWELCSGASFVVLSLFAVSVTADFRRLSGQRLRSMRSNAVFFIFSALGMVATLLQLYNAALLQAFWPFFAGIAFQLVGAMFQFVRMVLALPE
jgi:hypothetical protein